MIFHMCKTWDRMQILIWIGIQMEGRIRIGYLVSSYRICHIFLFYLNIEVKITLGDFLILRDFLESLIRFRN
jgi:hypothetical protein